MHLGEAEESFSKALAAMPNYLYGKSNHAISLLLQRRRATTVAPESGHLQTAPANMKAPTNLAAAFYEMARYAEASDACAKAVEFSPEDADLSTDLALALEKAGRSAEAKEAFADAARPCPPAH